MRAAREDGETGDLGRRGAGRTGGCRTVAVFGDRRPLGPGPHSAAVDGGFGAAAPRAGAPGPAVTAGAGGS
ncbi:hypothetical protein CG736_12240 [Kitasatospora sp. CB02891]|nr:hypothetical protein CG736_12240 [Kitasatospora sp. CB02891]